MSGLRVIIICNDRVSIPAIHQLAFHGQLAAVGVPAQNKETLEEIADLLGDSGIPLAALKKEEWVQQLTGLFTETKAAAGLIMTFPWKIGKQLAEIPPRGFLNFHYGSLPAYRGPEPVFAQLKNRELYAAVTVHQVTGEVDGGAVVMEERIKLMPRDTYGLLKAKLGRAAAKMAGNLLQIMAFSDRLPAKPQDESKAVWHPRPGPEEVKIRWKEMTGEQVIALINACNPWNKGAVTRIKNFIIRILEAEILSDQPGEFNEPGKIVLLNSGTVNVATADLQVIQLKIIYTPEGFMRAERLAELGVQTGDFFES